MTAARPYRMTPLTAEQALGELRKFAGIQFDPEVVDAFVKTHASTTCLTPGRTAQLRPIPLIGQAAATSRQLAAKAPHRSSTPSRAERGAPPARRPRSVRSPPPTVTAR